MAIPAVLAYPIVNPWGLDQEGALVPPFDWSNCPVLPFAMNEVIPEENW